MNDEAENVFRAALNVFREYLFDLDSDIEGCSADELREIEHMTEAARELRRRFVAHVTEGADARGMVECQNCPGTTCRACQGWGLVRLPGALNTKDDGQATLG